MSRDAYGLTRRQREILRTMQTGATLYEFRSPDQCFLNDRKIWVRTFEELSRGGWIKQITGTYIMGRGAHWQLTENAKAILDGVEA